jgi:hypothetical protein
MRAVIDLHNHSCLSPCADDDLTPALLAIEAMEKNIDILALTDHNSARNLEVFSQACELCSILPLFGLEVTTIEEVHVLTLFPKLEDALEFGTFIEFLLPPIKNKPKLFGRQLVVDLQGEVLQEIDLMLSSATSLGFSDVMEEALSRDALVIPAHIDRPANSVLANLGFLPSYPYSALEAIHPHMIKQKQNLCVLTGSDAHSYDQIGRRRCFAELEECSYEALKDALKDPRNISYQI